MSSLTLPCVLYPFRIAEQQDLLQPLIFIMMLRISANQTTIYWADIMSPAMFQIRCRKPKYHNDPCSYSIWNLAEEAKQIHMKSQIIWKMGEVTQGTRVLVIVTGPKTSQVAGVFYLLPFPGLQCHSPVYLQTKQQFWGCLQHEKHCSECK